MQTLRNMVTVQSSAAITCKFNATGICGSSNYAYKWVSGCISINLQFLLAKQYRMKMMEGRHCKFFPELF